MVLGTKTECELKPNDLGKPPSILPCCRARRRLREGWFEILIVIQSREI